MSFSKKTFLLTFALFGAVLAATAEIPPAEKLLPGDTLFMVTTPDFTKVTDSYHNSPHGQLWNDPAMKDFKDKFMAKFVSDYMIPLEHDLGVHFEDYTNLPQGQMTFAVVQNGWDGKGTQAPAMLFLMDTKGQSSKLKTNLIDLKKKWVDAGKTIKTEKIRDVEFSVVMFSGDDLPKSLDKSKSADPNTPEPFENPDLKNAPKSQIYIGQADSLLIMGNASAAIEKVLARMAGGEVKALGETASFSGNSAMFHDALTYGWVNAKTFLDIYGKSADGADTSDPMKQLLPSPKKIISATGLSGLGCIAFNYLYSSEGLQMNVKLAVPEGERTGLLKILAGQPKDVLPPSFVPADAVKFQRWRIDLPKTWEGLRAIVGELSPAGLVGLDYLIAQPESALKEKDPDFDFKKNVIGNLGDDLIVYQKSPQGDSMAEMASPPALFLIGSPQPDKLAVSLKSMLGIATAAEGESKDREFLGHKIYSVPMPAAPGSDTFRSFSFTASGGYLAGTTDTPILEEYLRTAENPGKPLKDFPGLSDASQKICGPGTSLFGFSNESELMRMMFAALKKDPSAKDPMAGLAPLALAAGMGDVKIKDWLDVSLLPAFDQVSKYFYFSVYSLSADADGINFKFFSPTPPALRK